MRGRQFEWKEVRIASQKINLYVNIPRRNATLLREMKETISNVADILYTLARDIASGYYRKDRLHQVLSLTRPPFPKK